MTSPNKVNESDWVKYRALVNGYLRKWGIWVGPSGCVYDDRPDHLSQWLVEFTPLEVMAIVEEGGVESLLVHIKLRRCFS